MLNEGILSFVLDLIRTEKLYSENIGDLFTRAGILLRGDYLRTSVCGREQKGRI